MENQEQFSWSPDQTFAGLDRQEVYGNLRFSGSKKTAKRIYMFGRLDLPEGYSVLEREIHIRENGGGNNETRWGSLPEGTEVFYKNTPGIWENLLWASEYPR